MREAHTSKVVGNFGVEKIDANLQRYVYFPIMYEYVAQFMRGCILCSRSKTIIKIKVNTMVPYLFLQDHGRESPWILWVVCQPLRMEMASFLC